MSTLAGRSLRSASATVARRQLSQQQRRSLATHAESSSSGSSNQASSSSSSTPSSWSPAIAPGKCAAYDEALNFISKHQAAINQRISSVEAASDVPAEHKKAILESLAIASQIDDPKVRWTFTNSPDDTLDLTNPTIRHLRERAWRFGGALAKLVERAKLQGVIPDATRYLVPQVDVQVIIGSLDGSGVGDHTPRATAVSGEVLPGVIVEPRNLQSQPTLRLSAFHEEPQKYTLLMVDLDKPMLDPAVPHERQSLISAENGRIASFCHWVVSDITLSAGSSRLLTSQDLLGGKEILPYVPPYPAQGSDRHRYAFMLCSSDPVASTDAQDAALSSSEPGKGNVEQSASHQEAPDRFDFDITTFLRERKLKPVGIHFVRSEWSEWSKKSTDQTWGSVEGKQAEVWGTVPRAVRKALAGQL